MQNSFSCERFRTSTRFETEAQENSEMAYCSLLYLAHRGSNQSGAEKDNGLLFREQ